MTRLQVEAETPVVEKDPRCSGDQVRAEVEGIRLGQRDPKSVLIDGADVGRVPVSQASSRWGDRLRGDGHVRRKGGTLVNPSSGAIESILSKESRPVRTVEEHTRAIMASGSTRFDGQVRPQRV